MPLPITLAHTPPTREELDGGTNDTKSLRNAVRLIEQAESTTQNCERPWQRVSEDENETELKGTIVSVSSYTSMHSSAVGSSPLRRGSSSQGTSLMTAMYAEVLQGEPYFRMIILRLAKVHFSSAA
jgi:hypothetical protein